MGDARTARVVRRSDRQVIKDFGIEQMQADLQTMASNVAGTANAVTNLGKKHDDLVKQCASRETAISVDIMNIATRMADLSGNLRDLNEVRNRGFWGRVKWLLFGK